MSSKTVEQKPAKGPDKAVPKTIVKPEDRELELKRQEQAAIEADLAERELRVETLRAELGAFERQYLHFVGSRYAELDDLKAQIAAHRAAAQPHDPEASAAAAEAQAQAEETKSSVGEQDKVPPKSFQATPEMKRLYREVAKRIHPDLVSDAGERERRQILMAEANRAYELGDESKLTKILTGYECSPDSVEGKGAGAELIRVIRRISQARNRAEEIDAEQQQLMRSELYKLKARLDEAQALGRDVLAEMAASVEQQIAQAQRHLEKSRPGSTP